MTIFIMGSSLVLGAAVEAKQDAWIAILLSIMMALPAIAIYIRLLRIFPGKDLFDLLHIVFGNFIGKTIALLYVWYAFHLGALVIRNFSEFIQIAAMPETPQYIMVLCMGVLCIWAVKEGIEVIGRCSIIVLLITSMSIIIVLVASLPQGDFINIKPILYNGFKPVISGAFSSFSFPFAETVLFTAIYSGLRNKKSTFKVFYISLFMGGAFILFTATRNLLVLGVDIASNMYFPTYSAVRLIQIGDFLQRVEVIVAIVFTFAGLGKICVCLLAACNGLAKVFNINNYHKLAIPVGLLMMNFSMLVYRNVMEMFDWAIKVYKYYAFPFQVILPIIILIAAEIKVRSNKKLKIS